MDLEKRVHKNQDIKSLGKMAFVILDTFLKRIEKLDFIELKKEMYNEMIQYNLVKNEYTADIMQSGGIERPPMIEIPEYRQKFAIDGQAPGKEAQGLPESSDT